MNPNIKLFTKFLAVIYIVTCLAACWEVPNSDHLRQEAGDVLNPEGRRREAEVAAAASQAAAAAAITALKANELSQSRLKEISDEARARADAASAAAKASIEAANKVANPSPK